MSNGGAIIIPARFASTRFPGKPLAKISGKPMIQHVWERCKKAIPEDRIYVATDDKVIAGEAEGFGARVVFTSSECLTGTDRIAEANESLRYDYVINVQGDEPLIDPNAISKVIQAYLGSGSLVNAMSTISSDEEYYSRNVPKVVVAEDSSLLYMSRAPIPSGKSVARMQAYKQVCVYAFSAEHLQFFASKKKKSRNEAQEDIEILRFLDHGYEVKMIEVESGSVAVDTPSDIDLVEAILKSSERI